MGVVTEKIVLRKRRKDGERLPNRVKLDKVSEDDTLIVEIVVNKREGIIHWYKFTPEQLAGRKAVVFTVSDSNSEVYWLRGLAPFRLYENELPEELQIESAPKRRGRKPKVDTNSPSNPDRYVEAKVRRMMIFDAEQKLYAMCPNLEAASHITGILPESIERLCKNKKPSRDTGLSFRYLTKLDPDIDIMDFSLTQYDENV